MIARVLRAFASLEPRPLVSRGRSSGRTRSKPRRAARFPADRSALRFASRTARHRRRRSMRIAEIPDKFRRRRADWLWRHAAVRSPRRSRTFLEAHRASEAELSFISVALDDPGAMAASCAIAGQSCGDRRSSRRDAGAARNQGNQYRHLLCGCGASAHRDLRELRDDNAQQRILSHRYCRDRARPRPQRRSRGARPTPPNSPASIRGRSSP